RSAIRPCRRPPQRFRVSCPASTYPFADISKKDGAAKPAAPFQGRFRSIFEAEAQGKASAIIDDVQRLVGEAAASAEGRVGEVQRREIHRELRRDVIAGAEVDRRAAIDEGRLGTELGIVLLLTEPEQGNVLPGAGDTGLEPV